MSARQAIRIRAPLQCGMRVGRFPVALDGLLWHSLFLKTGSEARALRGLCEYLSKTESVFRASALLFGVSRSQRLIATQWATVGAMRPGVDLSPDQFHPTGRKGKYTKVQVEGGPYKNRLTTHDTYHAPEVLWYAHGDGEGICKLLNFYVQGVGLDAQRGCGSVGRFSWESMEEDFSLVDAQGAPARIIPVSLYDSLIGRATGRLTIQAQTEPPYRNNPTVECVAPERIRRVILN